MFKDVESSTSNSNVQSRKYLHKMLSSLVLLLVVPLSSCDPYHQLSWFLHITDIHISHLDSPDRASQLQQLVTSHLPILRPDLVLCGGDLTDAKRPGHLTAQQNREEWQTYQEVVASRWNSVPWLDIRGNHDTLDVWGRNSSQNYFHTHSVQGPKGNLHSYSLPWQSRGQKFRFVAVDSTWEIGMTFPFNFEGYISEEEQLILEGIKKKLNAEEVTIMFGHYPSSVVFQSSYLRDLMKQSLVYLSGHLHDLAFFKMTNMYTFHGHQQGLELELVDWKINRAFRLLAVDHGSLTFIDLRFDKWPVVLPTFPKDQQFWQPSREDQKELVKDGKIRVLAFSDSVIVSVSVRVDGEVLGEAVKEGDGPLYTLAWSPPASGVHQLEVVVKDSRNRSSTSSHSFTLDPQESRGVDNWWPSFVLRSSFATVFHLMYALTLLANLTVMLVLRTLSCRLSCSSWCLVRKLQLVTSHNRLFYPLLCFLLYMSLGPWVLGPLVEGRLGAVFAWGVVVGGTWAHSQTTQVWYFLHFGVIHPLLVVVVGHLADWRCGRVGGRGVTGREHAVAGVLLLMGLATSLFFSLTFWLSFGVLGFFLGPLKTWSYVFYSAMFWLAATLPEEDCIRSAVCHGSHSYFCSSPGLWQPPTPWTERRRQTETPWRRVCTCRIPSNPRI